MTKRSMTPEQEREILRLHDEGVTFRAIADRLSVSKSAVQRTIERARAGPPETRASRGSRASPKGKPKEQAGAIPQKYVGLLIEVAEWWKLRKEAGKLGQASGQVQGQAGLALKARKQTYRIEEDLIEQLREQVNLTGLSQSVLVNRALRQFLEGGESD